MSSTSVSILGTGMTDMSRRDLTPEAMAYQALNEALIDASLDPNDLGLVIFSNALGGRLCDQGCIRGESWLRKAGLGEVPIINVDNSCASGSSALHLGTLIASGDDRPILVLGVEKMWTGDRAGTIAGIEDGLPSDYRADMHARFDPTNNPSGSILMGLNDTWARQMIEDRGSSVEQVAAAAMKAHLHGSLNPLAQCQNKVTIQEVLESPQVAGVLTRLMCSSFTDGAAAVILGGKSLKPPSSSPRIVGSVAVSGNGEIDYHERLSHAAKLAWEEFEFGPSEVDLVELHDATSAEELYALESLGFFEPGEAGPATLAGKTTLGGSATTVNTSGGLVGRGHPLGATGIAQVVELATQLRMRAGNRQLDGARLGVAFNTGGIIEGDAAFIGAHAVAAGN